MSRSTPIPKIAPEGLELATLAGGCFWCLETALFEVKGVVDVESGYAGSDHAPANYEAVCTGDTGLAEVVHILKLGSEKEKLERAKLAREETLLAAKVEDLATAKRVEHVYEEALSAMRTYQGQSEDYDDDYYQVMY